MAQDPRASPPTPQHAASGADRPLTAAGWATTSVNPVGTPPSLPRQPTGSASLNPGQAARGSNPVNPGVSQPGNAPVNGVPRPRVNTPAPNNPAWGSNTVNPGVTQAGNPQVNAAPWPRVNATASINQANNVQVQAPNGQQFIVRGQSPTAQSPVARPTPNLGRRVPLKTDAPPLGNDNFSAQVPQVATRPPGATTPFNL